MPKTLSKADKRSKNCPGCGLNFNDRSATNTRTYCESCKPPKVFTPEATRSAKVAGKPMTLAHFKRWSARFKLKDGKNFKLEQYQAEFLIDLFAREGGRPKFQELWLVVPEGNGKTTFLCLVILYFIEFKQEAWVPMAASARDQAVTLSYRNCDGFIRRNKLEGDYQLHPGYREIRHKHSLGTAKIFASDAASGDGVDPDLALIEELHRLPDLELYETWAGKLDKSDGQLVVVSTAGEPDSPFEVLRTTIRQSALEESHNGPCHGRYAGAGVCLHEYAIPEDADPEDIDLVVQANPFSGITKPRLIAKRNKPSWNLPHWRRFTCNMPTRDIAAAITEMEWAEALASREFPTGKEIWIGIDVAWRWDTTAIVPMHWENDDDRLLGPARVLVPPRDGSSLDVSSVRRAILELREVHKISTAVMDTHLAEDIVDWLESELGITVVDRAQTNTAKAEDYTRFMEALRGGKLKHTGDLDLKRHAMNAVTKVLPDGSARFYRSSTSRVGNQDARVIDALDAAAMVHSVRCDPPAPKPNYRTTGF